MTPRSLGGGSAFQPYSASPAVAATPAAPAADSTATRERGGADALDALLASLDAHGAEALRAARAELVALERPADMGTNALSWLGGRVSWHLRRAVLLDALRAHQWNLTHTACALRENSSNVLRHIRDLGLAGELAKAKAAGLARTGARTMAERGRQRAPKGGAR